MERPMGGISGWHRRRNLPDASQSLPVGLNGRQGASANGPAWAAPKKHRMPRKGELEKPGVLQGARVVRQASQSTE